MINFQTILRSVLVLFAGFILCFQNIASAEAPKVTNWHSIGILRDFNNAPNPQNYRISAPEIRQLDTSGGDLLFHITPVSDPGCTQTFRVGWVFERNIAQVREGESIGIQMYVKPANNAGVGLRDCYHRAKQRIYDGGVFSMGFRPSAAVHFHYKPEYKKYHEGSAQYLFVNTNQTTDVNITTQNATPGFLVLDSPHGNQPGYMEAKHGSLSFVMSKGGLFVYTVTYLFDAGAVTPPNDPLGRQWIESESGWQGVWTRRDNSNIFDARWGSITAELTITVTGNQVTIARRNSSDGNNCNYTGTIASDGVTVEGTYICDNLTEPRPWRATIQ